MAPVVKSLPAMQETQEMQVQFLGRDDLLKDKWQPTPVFLPEKSYGQRSLAGYSPKAHKESDANEHKCGLAGTWTILKTFFFQIFLCSDISLYLEHALHPWNSFHFYIPSEMTLSSWNFVQIDYQVLIVLRDLSYVLWAHHCQCLTCYIVLIIFKLLFTSIKMVGILVKCVSLFITLFV